MDSPFGAPLAPATQMFLRYVPMDLGLDIAKVIRAATRTAHASHADFRPGARRDLYPYERHALAQTGLLELAPRYQKTAGVTAAERPNKTGNRTHVELYAGKVVVIAHAVEGEDVVIRDAAYRNSLAENPQAPLPGLPVPDLPPPGRALLAAVLYGPSSAFPANNDMAQPGFVVVKFPASDWSCYVDGRIDLLSRLSASERGEPVRWAPTLRQHEDIA